MANICSDPARVATVSHIFNDNSNLAGMSKYARAAKLPSQEARTWNPTAPPSSYLANIHAIAALHG